MELDKLVIPQRIRNSLEKAQITSVSSILKTSAQDLTKLANLTEEEITLLKSVAAKSFVNLKFISGLEIRKAESFRRLSVGCSKLDEFLRGGVRVRGITEIVGESGSGKTQLCLQLSLTAQYPVTSGGLDGGAVYICTEGAFPSARLQQLTRTVPARLELDLKRTKVGTKFGDNIFIEHIADVESLKDCIRSRVPTLLAKRNIKLVVIDSMAGVFRAEYEQGMAASRARELQNVGSQLHQLAQLHNLAVVCVNQVTDVPSKDQMAGRTKPVACLGLAWANVVTTRLQLCRVSSQLRTMDVIFSPDLPSETCHFNVTAEGVRAVS